MPGGKILIFLLILLFVTFALRFVGSVPGLVPLSTETAPTSTVTGSSVTSTPAAGSATAPKPKSKPKVTAPIPQPVPVVEQPVQQQPSIDPSQIPPGFSANQLSPYFRKVIFASVYSPGDITVSSAFDEGPAIDVTGWLIQANRGGQVIPQAVNVYDPSGLAAETDIYLRPSDMLRMFSSVSTIGKNFRLNECIGALENENHFTPSLPGYCPSLYKDPSEISSFTGRCQDYISYLNYCSVPDFYSTDIPRDDYACQAFLQNVNFKGCFDKYRGDADFLKNEIWVWTGNDRLLDDRHDRVLLLDKAGLLVDIYSY